MDPLSSAIVDTAQRMQQGALRQQVSIAVLKTAMDAQASAAAALIAALPQVPQPAATGLVGTRLDVYA